MNESSVRHGANGEERVRYYPTEHDSRNHEKNLAELISEIRDEVKEFVTTRVRMIRTELRESIGAVRIAVPLALIALGFIVIASLVFTAACITLVASAFVGTPYAWFYGFIIIGCLWVMFAGIAGFFAYNHFKEIFPRRTIQVIKADKVWLQREARSHS
jgi:uncharacterized membrane protein YqjE